MITFTSLTLCVFSVLLSFFLSFLLSFFLSFFLSLSVLCVPLNQSIYIFLCVSLYFHSCLLVFICLSLADCMFDSECDDLSP